MNIKTRGIAAAVIVATSFAFAGADDILLTLTGAWVGDGAFSNLTDHAIGDIPAHGTGTWQSNAVLAIDRNMTIGSGSADVDVYGIS